MTALLLFQFKHDERAITTVTNNNNNDYNYYFYSLWSLFTIFQNTICHQMKNKRNVKKIKYNCGDPLEDSTYTQAERKDSAVFGRNMLTDGNSRHLSA